MNTPRDAFHMLKVWPEFWEPLKDESKPFEVRRFDRDYRVGDVLILQLWSPIMQDYIYDSDGVPETLSRRVTFLLPGGQFGIEEGFCVMGVRNVRNR